MATPSATLITPKKPSNVRTRVHVIHGTNQLWRVLVPRGLPAAPTSPNDPNPTAVYVALKSRRKMPHIAHFAHSAAALRGGHPVIALAKVRADKGWRPYLLTSSGRLNLGTVNDARDLVDELICGAAEPRRGEIWRLLHSATGAWRNDDPAVTVRPYAYVSAP